MSLYTNYNTVQIYSLYKLCICKLMHSVIYNCDSIPTVITDLFTLNTAIHSHYTRSFNQFHVQGSISLEAINYIGPYFWFKLPTYIRDCPNLPNFLKLCKNHLNGERLIK